MDSFFITLSATHFIALLYNRQLVDIDTNAGVSYIGFPIQDRIDALDEKTLQLTATDTLVRIGDKDAGYYWEPSVHMWTEVLASGVTTLTENGVVAPK